MSTQYLAVHQGQLLIQGSLEEIVVYVKGHQEGKEPILFEFETCKRTELNWYGDIDSVLASFASLSDHSGKSRGRPKLGVKSKEVTLLPRHWEWLSMQKGGASATLRRLVEEAQKNASIEDTISLKQQQLDQFMLAFLGDKAGYEEASRALYRNSLIGFEKAIKDWSDDIKTFVLDKFHQISELHKGESLTNER
jgi:uncharacterized protein